MSRNLINLLPPERLRAFRREYWVRLATIAALMLALVFVVGAAFLLPSYRALSSEIVAKQTSLAALQVRTNGASDVAASLASSEADAAYLAELRNQPTASGAIRAVLDIPRSGVLIEGMSFAPPSATAIGGKMTLTGTATTREALRAYDLALSSAAFISNVDLPISAYAQESNISFTMTLTGSFAP